MSKLTKKEKRDYMFNYYRKKRNWACKKKGIKKNE